MAAEMIFSRILSEEHHIFSTTNWYYSTVIPRVVYTADHGTAVSHLQQLACDPHDTNPGILWMMLASYY